MVDDLKMIKKMYGEKMMHLCRELFSTILETPGLMYSLMEKSFAPTHYLYDDIIGQNRIVDFKNYIYSLLDNSLEMVRTDKTPFELMDEAGYKLYECKSEEDIQKFKKYYEKGEELCTFNGGRLNSCYVFFAVKKNVDRIRRKDFLYPERQDEYGTSVISIQFSKKGRNTLSIKNRYNHRVANPDATYSNNLENIIPGLSNSFEKMYGFKIEQNIGEKFELRGYVLASDGRYYKYNYEINNIYYCPDNIIIENFEVKNYYREKEKYLVIDYFVIDLANKKIIKYDRNKEDSFIYYFRDIDLIKKIDVRNRTDNLGKVITITPDEGEDVIIVIDKFNRIVEYKNNNIVEIGNSFLSDSREIKNVELLNVTRVGDNFLYFSTKCEDLKMPSLEECGSYFMYANITLKRLDLPKLKYVERGFLSNNERLEYLNLPSVRYIGDYFLSYNNHLKKVNLPNLEKCGKYFLSGANEISKIDLPKLEMAGDCFLEYNDSLICCNLPKLMMVGSLFLTENNSLVKLSLPSLRMAGSYFLDKNRRLRYVNLPSLVTVGSNFISSSRDLEVINLPMLERWENDFLTEYHLRENITRAILKRINSK